jgi:RNA polymerase primary sigma factor
MASAPQENSTILAKYFTEISGRTVLTREEEADLVELYRRGSQKALERLVEANLRFVVKMAGEYRNLGVPFEDLINEGNVGLIEAARSFDGSRGNKFITYAMWWVRKYILKAIDDHSSVVRIPSYQRTQIRKIRRAENHLRSELGREPRREEVNRSITRAASAGSRSTVGHWLETSLDGHDGKDGEQRSLYDVLADHHCQSPEDALLRQEVDNEIVRAVNGLTEKEKSVIASRYGLGGERLKTLKEVGTALGVSRERARQIEEQAKSRLRRMLLRRGLAKAATVAIRTRSSTAV